VQGQLDDKQQHSDVLDDIVDATINGDIANYDLLIYKKIEDDGKDTRKFLPQKRGRNPQLYAS